MLCAAMPFTASAQGYLPTTTEFRIFCAEAVFQQKTVIQDLPTIVNKSLGGKIGYAECLNAVSTTIKESKDFAMSHFIRGNWMENENFHKMINLNICINRMLSGWERGVCDEYFPYEE